MALFSRDVPGQERLTDQIYALIKEHGSVSTKQLIRDHDLKNESSVLAAIDLLQEEGKIRVNYVNSDQYLDGISTKKIPVKLVAREVSWIVNSIHGEAGSKIPNKWKVEPMDRETHIWTTGGNKPLFQVTGREGTYDTLEAALAVLQIEVDRG